MVKAGRGRTSLSSRPAPVARRAGGFGFVATPVTRPASGPVTTASYRTLPKPVCRPTSATKHSSVTSSRAHKPTCTSGSIRAPAAVHRAVYQAGCRPAAASPQTVRAAHGPSQARPVVRHASGSALRTSKPVTTRPVRRPASTVAAQPLASRLFVSTSQSLASRFTAHVVKPASALTKTLPQKAYTCHLGVARSSGVSKRVVQSDPQSTQGTAPAKFNLGHVFGVNAANLIDGARSGPEYSQERLKLHEKILKSDFNTSRTLASTNNGYIKRQENQIAKVLTGEKPVSQLDPGSKQRLAQMKSAYQDFVGPASRQIGMVGWANKADKTFGATKPPNPKGQPIAVTFRNQAGVKQANQAWRETIDLT